MPEDVIVVHETQVPLMKAMLDQVGVRQPEGVDQDVEVHREVDPHDPADGDEGPAGLVLRQPR